MKTLLDMYNESSAPGVVRARQQKDGKLTYSYMDGVPAKVGEFKHSDTIQKEFNARNPGDKEVFQSQEEDQTKGTWLGPAFKKYDDFLSRINFRQYHGKIVHIYDRYNDQYSIFNENTHGIKRYYWAGLL